MLCMLCGHLLLGCLCVCFSRLLSNCCACEVLSRILITSMGKRGCGVGVWGSMGVAFAFHWFVTFLLYVSAVCVSDRYCSMPVAVVFCGHQDPVVQS